MFYEVITSQPVPWDYPNLSNKTTTTSPFTIVFREAGSSMSFISFLLPEVLMPYSAAAASFMNTVILTSVLSAGNHALFAGTRVLYGKNITEYRLTI
jgi:AAT family amino acid transporter